MYLSDLLERELLALAGRVDHPLTIIETGSIRSAEEQYRLNDGWSTLTFAEWVRHKGGRVMSVDLDTAAAHTVLTRAGLRDHVDLHQGDSLDFLADLICGGDIFADLTDPPRVDLLFLDTDNDADLILKEYLLGRQLLTDTGVVIVDDVDLASPHVHKGDDLVPFLDAQGVRYRIEQRRGTTYSTGVLIVGEGL